MVFLFSLVKYMQCPFCGADELGVLESREADTLSIRRRRICGKCERRFTTYERVEGVDLVVVKKDGRKETFDREKLRRGIVKATWKRPVTLQQIENLMDEVERKLRQKNSAEVKSWEIGNLVINKLKKIDAMAYLLFASVYRDFQELKEFETEIKDLKVDEKNRRKINRKPKVKAANLIKVKDKYTYVN